MPVHFSSQLPHITVV